MKRTWEKLYWSTDDGALYTEDMLETPINPDQYVAYLVYAPVVLTVEDLTQGENSILEILMRGGEARQL